MNVCLGICLEVLSGPELCRLVPTWIDLMVALDIWVKLAKPDPMSNEMKTQMNDHLTNKTSPQSLHLAPFIPFF